MAASPQVAASADPLRETFRVFYDGECEICQAGVSWLRLLDKDKQCECIPITAEVLEIFTGELDLDACLRELHILTPNCDLFVCSEAIARLARLFPSTRWIGTLAVVPPFRQLSRLAYRFVARNRYALSKCRGGACRVSKPEIVRKRAGLAAFWSCHAMGLLARFPLVSWAALRSLKNRLAVFSNTRRARIELLH
jgi:predicted DCC family thiol-disulfide oxidoreductase YuxK